jgi:dihydroflavonol-4-reductase
MEKRSAKTGEKPLMTKFAVCNLDRNNSFDYSKAEQAFRFYGIPSRKTSGGWQLRR